MRKFFLVGLLMSFSNLALAGGFNNGNDLKKYLDASENDIGTFHSGIFSGYVTGVHDTLDGIVICSPSSTTVGQVKAIVGKYLKANPELWNEPAERLVANALSQAFPCKETK